MRKRNWLLFFMIGFLAVSFILPVFALERPDYALDPEDVPGWSIMAEGTTPGSVNWGAYASGLDMWWQVWINNKTSENAWQNATACVCIMIIKFPFNISSQTWWAMLIFSFNITGGTETEIEGYDRVIMFEINSTWWAIAARGDLLITVIGYGATGAPPGPFLIPLVKAPTSSSASENDIILILSSQAEKLSTYEFPNNGERRQGISGFNSVPIFIAIILLINIFFILRKCQLNLLKSY